MVTGRHVPDAGEIMWLAFTPQAGHEQAGRRPGLVLSPRIYNQKSGLALFCPITSNRKGFHSRWAYRPTPKSPGWF